MRKFFLQCFLWSLCTLQTQLAMSMCKSTTFAHLPGMVKGTSSAEVSKLNVGSKLVPLENSQAKAGRSEL